MDLPNTVILRVTETNPPIRGATARRRRPRQPNSDRAHHPGAVLPGPGEFVPGRRARRPLRRARQGLTSRVASSGIAALLRLAMILTRDVILDGLRAAASSSRPMAPDQVGPPRSTCTSATRSRPVGRPAGDRRQRPRRTSVPSPRCVADRIRTSCSPARPSTGRVTLPATSAAGSKVVALLRADDPRDRGLRQPRRVNRRLLEISNVSSARSRSTGDAPLPDRPAALRGRCTRAIRQQAARSPQGATSDRSPCRSRCVRQTSGRHDRFPHGQPLDRARTFPLRRGATETPSHQDRPTQTEVHQCRFPRSVASTRPVARAVAT